MAAIWGMGVGVASFMLEHRSSRRIDILMAIFDRGVGTDEGHISISGAVGERSLRGSKHFIPDTDLLELGVEKRSAEGASCVNNILRACMHRRQRDVCWRWMGSYKESPVELRREGQNVFSARPAIVVDPW
jgi:hypothetical protein